MSEVIPNSSSKKTQLIGIGDVLITKETDALLLMHGVGASVGVLFYDACTNTTGLIHLMLPDSGLSPNRVESKPGMFADTGIQHIITKLTKELNIPKDCLKVFITGGSTAITNNASLKIGERNIEQVKMLLEKEDIPIFAEELGGRNNRSLAFDTRIALIQLKENLQKKEIPLS